MSLVPLSCWFVFCIVVFWPWGDRKRPMLLQTFQIDSNLTLPKFCEAAVRKCFLLGSCSQVLSVGCFTEDRVNKVDCLCLSGY